MRHALTVELEGINKIMRFDEFKPVKPKGPLTRAQARIANLKCNAEIARQALKRERAFQKQHKLVLQQQKLSQQKIKP